MENMRQDLERLKYEFRACQSVITALGDETRQRLLLMMLSGPCEGSRVVDIAERTHLSRPAVSRHMQILKEAGIVSARREGTMIYYYLNPGDHEMEQMIRLFQDIKKIMGRAPERGGED